MAEKLKETDEDISSKDTDFPAKRRKSAPTLGEFALTGRLFSNVFHFSAEILKLIEKIAAELHAKVIVLFIIFFTNFQQNDSAMLDLLTRISAIPEPDFPSTSFREAMSLFKMVIIRYLS